MRDAGCWVLEIGKNTGLVRRFDNAVRPYGI